jgi:hypothetical protein
MNHRFHFLISLLCLFLLANTAIAIIGINDRGTWPEDWPAELEPLRESSRTIMVGTGIQENVYEIPIRDRETFDKVWPAILNIRTPGGPLTLRRTTPPLLSTRQIQKSDQPTIRIYAPSGGISMTEQIDPENPPDWEALIRDGRALRAQAPWPESIVGKNGELPEYVVSELVDGRMTWLPADPYDEGQRELFPGFFNRVRIDVELVIDGQIIDLNHVRLPDGAIVIDRRFDEPPSPAKDVQADSAPPASPSK